MKYITVHPSIAGHPILSYAHFIYTSLQEKYSIPQSERFFRVASDTGIYWDVLHVLGKKLCTSKCTEKRLFFSSVLGNVLGFFYAKVCNLKLKNALNSKVSRGSSPVSH